MKKNTSTAIEITDTHVKLMQVMSARGTPIITCCRIAPHQNLAEAEIAKLVSKMASSAKVHLDGLTAVISRRDATLLHFQLPTQFDEEIRQMLSLQISHKVPYAKEEIVFDYILLEKNSSGYAKVLAVVVQKSVVDRYVGIFRRAGIQHYSLTLSSLGLNHWYIYQKNKRQEGSSFPSVIMNIDTHSTEICFCRQKELLFSREVNVGLSDLGAANVDTLVEQLSLTLATYRKEKMGEEISEVLIIGDAQETDQLIEKLRSRSDIPIYVIPCLEGFPCEKTISAAEAWKKHKVSLSVITGLLFSDFQNFLSLLPVEVVDSREKKQKKRQWIKTGVLFFVAAVLSILVLGFDGFQNRRELKEVNGRLNQIKPKVKDFQDKIRQVRILNEELNSQFFLPDYIVELHEVTPNGIAYDSLKIDSKGVLTLEGVSKDGSLVNSLQANIVSSLMFYNVRLQYAKKRKSIRGEITNFKMMCEMSKDLKSDQ